MSRKEAKNTYLCYFKTNRPESVRITLYLGFNGCSIGEIWNSIKNLKKKLFKEKKTLSNRKEKKWQNYKTLDSQREKQIQIEIKSRVTASMKA